MPYQLTRKGKKFFVSNKATGSVKGAHSTKEKAIKQMNLLRGIEHGWTPTRAK